MKTYIGIDPGITGAVSMVKEDGTAETRGIERSLHDAVCYLAQIKQNTQAYGHELYAVIEKVGAMPKQGVSSTFAFGCTYGHLRGALIALGIPIIAEPTPVVWKRKIFGAGIFKLSKPQQKRAARDEARKLYPCLNEQLRLVKDADKAEAALLAHYGMLFVGGGLR